MYNPKGNRDDAARSPPHSPFLVRYNCSWAKKLKKRLMLLQRARRAGPRGVRGALIIALWCYVTPSAPQMVGDGYTGYDGFWIYEEEKPTVHGGIGTEDVVARLDDSVSPCRYDGRICTTSKFVLSEPGEFVHNTGRSYCTARTSVADCSARMRARGFAQRLDELRPTPYELYPEVDGHTTTTFVSGTNFHGELGLGVRVAVHRPTIQTYFKLGDGRYEQVLGAGRGFKNVSMINFGFGHGFALDTQGVFYAWGSNKFGQLGIQNRAHRDGHRYISLWPQPLPFFRPFRVPMCEGGISDLRFCDGPDDIFTCFPRYTSSCRQGANQVARRRNAFAASKQPSEAAHSAAITDFFPEGCFNYEEFLDEDVSKNGFNASVGGNGQAPCSASPEGAGGKLYTWGYNIKGQLGLGTSTTFEQLPREVAVPGGDPEDRWYSVGLGGQHTVASTIRGKVYTWGLNDEGQLGVDVNYMAQRCTGPVARGECCNGFCNKPQLIRGACNSAADCLEGVKIIHVAAGLSFTVLLDVQGGVWAFGSNAFGQLCQGRRVREFEGEGSRPIANLHVSTANWASTYPARAQLPGDVRIADVVAGYYHVLAVTTDGYLFAWGRNDRGQLGRGHTEHDSCHLEIRTELPAPLDMECGKSRVNGSALVPRLALCNIIPGNTTTASAGEFHSGAITRANYTWRDPQLGVTRSKHAKPFKYPGNVLDFPLPMSYEPAKMRLDCDGPYNEDCKEQGMLHRWPNRLAHVYMFGDNRFGQLGLPETDALHTTPQLLREFLVYDWGGIALGARQSFWTSRVNTCSGNCNGHGICNHDTGRCTCEEPWTYELDCLTAWCPNNCSGNGACFPRLDVGDTVRKQGRSYNTPK
jgi:alpha-tubulin suppressor-like RCC1 family protein